VLLGIFTPFLPVVNPAFKFCVIFGGDRLPQHVRSQASQNVTEQGIQAVCARVGAAVPTCDGTFSGWVMRR
jgi:hypothetical protein